MLIETNRKNENDTKRMIKRTARFSLNEESSIKKENKNMQWGSAGAKTWERK